MFRGRPLTAFETNDCFRPAAELPLSEIPELIAGKGPDKTLKVQAVW